MFLYLDWVLYKLMLIIVWCVAQIALNGLQHFIYTFTQKLPKLNKKHNQVKFIQGKVVVFHLRGFEILQKPKNKLVCLFPFTQKGPE